MIVTELRECLCAGGGAEPARGWALVHCVSGAKLLETSSAIDVLGRTIPSSVLVHRPLEVRNRERRDSR